MSHHSKLARLSEAHDAQFERQPRKLVQEFPHAFEGLLPFEALAVARRARSLAGSTWAIREHHLNQARFEHDAAGRFE